MLSVHSPNPLLKSTSSLLKSTNPFFKFLNPFTKPHLHLPKTQISSSLSSSTPQNQNQQQQQVYQPYRPPATPLPVKFRSLDAAGRLDILSNRLGLWFEYAPLLSALIQDGFTPPAIEESTGISGVEQNRLMVGAKVRDSLAQSNADERTLAYFDLGGAELLYEIRLLSNVQRCVAARFLVDNKFDANGARDLARAMKDFPRRRGDRGWDRFDYNIPGDCLSFMYYRQGLEHKNPSEQRTNSLQQALQFAATESSKKVILSELDSKSDSEKDAELNVKDGVRVPVVRMKFGEVSEATSVTVLPVCLAEERGGDIMHAPSECTKEGDFGVVVAEKGWKRWVVLPSWDPLVGLGKGGVAIAFGDARALPWKVNRWYKEESILVVTDRARKEVVASEGFYLITVEDGGRSNGLKVERGATLIERGVKESLGTVVLVVRPPKDDNDDQITEEEWE